MTLTQERTLAFADHILNAPRAHLDAEPRACLLELIDVAIEHLKEIPESGLPGWKILRLEGLRNKVAPPSPTPK